MHLKHRTAILAAQAIYLFPPHLSKKSPEQHRKRHHYKVEKLETWPTVIPSSRPHDCQDSYITAPLVISSCTVGLALHFTVKTVSQEQIIFAFYPPISFYSYKISRQHWHLYADLSSDTLLPQTISSSCSEIKPFFPFRRSSKFAVAAPSPLLLCGHTTRQRHSSFRCRVPWDRMFYMPVLPLHLCPSKPTCTCTYYHLLKPVVELGIGQQLYRWPASEVLLFFSSKANTGGFFWTSVHCFFGIRCNTIQLQHFLQEISHLQSASHMLTLEIILQLCQGVAERQLYIAWEGEFCMW